MRKYFPYNELIIRDNIEGVLQQSTFKIYKEAKEWYPTANKYAENFADKYDVDIIITSALISCLSPQKNWFHNLELTEDFLKSKGVYCRHTGSQVEKARKIYAQREAIIIPICKILGGKKTTNFFFNICWPKSENHVTIDSHMCQLMTGDFNYKVPTDKQYDFLKNIIIEMAKENHMIPSEFQSVLWLTWKSIKPKRINI